MAQQFTTEDLRAITECKGKAMITDLGTTYRAGLALPSVSDFQKSWNKVLPAVRGIAGVLLPTKYTDGHLDEDGLYGKQSSIALHNFLVVKPAERAVDMPVWAAANQSAVNAMCPPTSPIAPVPEPVSLPPQISPSQPPPIQQIKIGPAEILPAPIPLEPKPAPSAPVQLQPVVVQPRAPGLLPEGPIELPPTTIIAAPERGDVPFVAIGIGAAVVGGVLAMWLYKRKRR